jgi:hypothetical protein
LQLVANYLKVSARHLPFFRHLPFLQAPTGLLMLTERTVSNLIVDYLPYEEVK